MKAPFAKVNGHIFRFAEKQNLPKTYIVVDFWGAEFYWSIKELNSIGPSMSSGCMWVPQSKIYKISMYIYYSLESCYPLYEFL